MRVKKASHLKSKKSVVKTSRKRPAKVSSNSNLPKFSAYTLFTTISTFFKYFVILAFLWGINIVFYDVPTALSKMLFILIAALTFMGFLYKKVAKAGKIYYSPLIVASFSGLALFYLLRALTLFLKGYKFLDISVFANYPFGAYIFVPVLALLTITYFLTKYEGKIDDLTEKLPKKLQIFVIFSIIFNSLLVTSLVHFKKNILQNGGVMNYIFKGFILGFAQKFSIQAILSLTLGNTLVSIFGFFILFAYWFSNGREFNSIRKYLSYILSLVWLAASYILALSSYNLLLIWMVLYVAFFAEYYWVHYKGKATLISQIRLFIVSLSLFVGFVLGSLYLVHKTVNSVFQGLTQAVTYQVKGIGDWVKVISHVTALVKLVSVKIHTIGLIFLGYVYGATAELQSILASIGVNINNTFTFHYLAGFGLLGLLLIIYGIYCGIKFVLTYKEKTWLVTVPMLFLGSFFVQMTPYYFYLMLLVFGMISLFNRKNIENVVVKNTKLVRIKFYSITAFLLAGITYCLSVISNYHYVVIYKNQVISDLNTIIGKLSQNKQQSEKVNVPSSDIKQFQEDFSRFMLKLNKLNTSCSACEQAKIANYEVTNMLYEVGMKYSQIYNILVRAPNIEAQNQFVATVYDLQKTAWMPLEYKLLGQAWYKLSQNTRASIYVQRTMVNYDRYLTFAPLDSQVLQQYLDILLGQYKASLGQNQDIEAKAAMEKKIKAMLALLEQSGIVRLKSTNQIDLLLNAAVYKAQYYMLVGNKTKAKEAFSLVKNIIKNAKLQKDQEDRLLEIVKQVEEKVLQQNQTK